MTCEHPDCTGNHNDRRYATLCPRTKANKRRQTMEEWYRNHDRRLATAARYRTTSAFMLAQVKYEASRRGGRSREATQSD